MTQFRKRAMAAAAVVLPLSLALGACSGGAGAGGSGEGGADGDPNTLTVWAWDPAFNIYALEAAEAIYQEENPDFSLEIEEIPWEDLEPRLTTLAQSQEFGELPDIFLMQNNAFQKNGINYPDLFSEISGDAIDFSEFPESVTAYSTFDGANYGVPFDAGTAVTALRTDLLEQSGLTVDDFTDITWDEFITLGEQVREATGQPLLTGQAGSADLPMMMLQSAGASLFDDEGNPTIADNATLEAAIDVYQRLVESGVLVEVNTWDEYIGTLTNGSVAGTINGIWIVGSIQTADDQSGLWNVTNLPALDVDGATNYSANGGSSWAISSNADVELATDFLASTFAGSNELYDEILPASGAVANWIPAGGSAVYEEPNEYFGGQPIFAEVVTYGAEVPSNNTGAYYYEARDAVSAAITQTLNGADLADALGEAQSNVEFAMN